MFRQKLHFLFQVIRADGNDNLILDNSVVILLIYIVITPPVGCANMNLCILPGYWWLNHVLRTVGPLCLTWLNNIKWQPTGLLHWFVIIVQSIIKDFSCVELCTVDASFLYVHIHSVYHVACSRLSLVGSLYAFVDILLCSMSHLCLILVCLHLSLVAASSKFIVFVLHDICAHFWITEALFPIVKSYFRWPCSIGCCLTCGCVYFSAVGFYLCVWI